MIELSVMIEGMYGLTWPIWKRLAAQVEPLGFAGLFRSDHFTVATSGNPDALELMISLAYLADHTERIYFGPLVAPLSFRDPVMLARQAAALDDLSGGRMILGVGAGWMEREHAMFGYELGDVPTRMARFAEGLEVITRLLRSEEPVTYTGHFYRLQEAALRPRPQRPGGPPLLIGGTGPRRTLPLAARYADIWNAHGITLEEFGERSAQLDQLLHKAGRDTGSVRRTFMIPVLCGRDSAELEQRVRGFRRFHRELTDLPLDVLLDELRRGFGGIIVGSAEEVVEQIRAYEQAGVEELMAQCFTVDDFAGLDLLADQVLPHFAG